MRVRERCGYSGDGYGENMPLGPLMVDIEGTELSLEDQEILTHPLIGGVILFSRNYVSREQLKHLVEQIHALRDPRLVVAVDHEGGTVQRFRDDFTHLPASAQLGSLYQDDSVQALKLSRDVGWLLALELRAIGVDISFTPVLDVAQADSQVLNHRTYHSDPQVVAELAHQLMLGMQEAGMQATGKHFPGHGGVSGDSHHELPVDNRSFADIYALDILPFERMIHYGLAGIMPAHVVYPQIDSNPAGFSPIWLQDILRKRLEFTGIIFSDDLSMSGAYVAGGYPERAHAALEAGCDVLLVCNNRPGAIEIIDANKPVSNPVLQMRMAHMHGRMVDELTAYTDNPRWIKTVDAVRLLHDEYPVEQELDF